MQVKDRMSPDPVTVSPQATVDEALRIMRQYNVRHLPVLEHGQLRGLVTDGELRAAWLASLLEELTVKDLMVTNPPTVQSEASVYEAARLLYQQKLTGLLVEEGGRLVGIITLADILRLFVDIMGLLRQSIQLEVALPVGEQSVDHAYRIIREQGGEIISVALISLGPERRRYSFRLEGTDPEPIKQALSQAGCLVG